MIEYFYLYHEKNRAKPQRKETLKKKKLLR